MFGKCGVLQDANPCPWLGSRATPPTMYLLQPRRKPPLRYSDRFSKRLIQLRQASEPFVLHPGVDCRCSLSVELQLKMRDCAFKRVPQGSQASACFSTAL